MGNKAMMLAKPSLNKMAEFLAKARKVGKCTAAIPWDKFTRTALGLSTRRFQNVRNHPDADFAKNIYGPDKQTLKCPHCGAYWGVEKP